MFSLEIKGYKLKYKKSNRFSKSRLTIQLPKGKKIKMKFKNTDKNLIE